MNFSSISNKISIFNMLNLSEYSLNISSIILNKISKLIFSSSFDRIKSMHLKKLSQPNILKFELHFSKINFRGPIAISGFKIKSLKYPFNKFSRGDNR